jgi:hypothetical protein
VNGFLDPVRRATVSREEELRLGEIRVGLCVGLLEHPSYQETIASVGSIGEISSAGRVVSPRAG